MRRRFLSPLVTFSMLLALLGLPSAIPIAQADAASSGRHLTIKAGGKAIEKMTVTVPAVAIRLVSNIHLEVVAPNHNASWISFNPAQVKPVFMPAVLNFIVVINVPSNAKAGNYHFDIEALADDRDIGHQALTITVPAPLCMLHSTPSMVEMGMGATGASIADVLRVSCQPINSHNTVTIDATQLYWQCQQHLVWEEPPSLLLIKGTPQFTVTLDSDGNATAVVFGGPFCAPTTTRFFATLNAAPFPAMSTTLTVRPPSHVTSGVAAFTRSVVEDDLNASVATVIQVDFPSSLSGQTVTITSDGLFAHCDHNLAWIGPDGASLLTGTDSVKVKLDSNGNAFVVLIGGPNCVSGTFLILADLNIVPYTEYFTTFTIRTPRPMV